MIKRSRFFIIALLVFIGALSAFYSYFKNESGNGDTFVTALVTRGDVEDVVTAYGVIQPLNYVDIGAQVSGILKTLYVDYGDIVKEGDLLVEIDDAIYKSKVEADIASIANLKAQLISRQAAALLTLQQYNRSVELYKEEAISQDLAETSKSNYDQAMAGIDSLKAQIDQAEATLRSDDANLTYTRILAPMNGTVINLVARQGQTLNANQTAPIILRLADLDKMTVWAQVSEADISKLRIGMTAYFNTLGRLDRRLYGTLRIIYPTPEVITGAIFYDVLFDVDNYDHSLLPQMSAQVFFVIDEAKDVLLVPVVALKKIPSNELKTLEESGARRFKVDVLMGDEIETRVVRVGVMGRLNAEVLSGLNEGDKVIIGRKNQEAASSAESPPRSPLPAVPGGSLR